MNMDPDEAVRAMGRATQYGDWPEVLRIAEALQHWHEVGGFGPHLFLQPAHNTALVPSETPRCDTGWL